MTNEFKSIADIINSTPELVHIKKIIEEKNVEQDFYKIFPELKMLVKSVRYSKNILKLSIENSALRTELKFRETEIIKKINEYYQDEKVKRIQFSNK
ncbi:MAG: DUF721 domain-containing protein [Ignavibacterium sp.]|nr:DUF721 domain-containing protein [Ignavibacterium sp.]MDW8376002.1 DciA family protein [Ignavibacteriales bacterium]